MVFFYQADEVSQYAKNPSEFYKVQLHDPQRSNCEQSQGWPVAKASWKYQSLLKEHQRVEHLTNLLKREMNALSSVSAFNHKKAPMYAYSDSMLINLLKY